MAQHLGTYLRTVREKAGLSQLDLSEAMGLKSAQYLSNIERGVSSLSKAMIPVVAKILKVDAEDIVNVILKDIKEKYLKGLGGRGASKDSKKDAKKKRR